MNGQLIPPLYFVIGVVAALACVATGLILSLQGRKGALSWGIVVGLVVGVVLVLVLAR